MHRRDQIDQRIADCLNHYDRFWFFEPVMKGADDLEIKRKGDIDKGEIDLWAAALIYAIVKHINLDQTDSIILLTLNNVASFYGIESRKVLKKANLIGKALRLGDENDSYRQFDFSYLEDDQEDLDENLENF